MDLQHAAGLGENTRVEMVSPLVGSLSPALAALSSAGLVRIRCGAG
jgi:hypothetical protein